ncbi:MAG: cytidine deaminase [Bacteroidales bacterium]|nr:cytidine deaminase [Bacteroidales bacterium]
MNSQTIIINLFEANDSTELEKADQELLSSAVQATLGAYTPYSHFKVGAAVRMSNGIIVTGNNQENAAYPSGLCAERTALFYAHSQYPHLAVEAMAIAAQSGGAQTADPVYPCGACRQVMLESQKRAGKPVRVIMGGAQKIQVVENVGDLLPLGFEEF